MTSVVWLMQTENTGSELPTYLGTTRRNKQKRKVEAFLYCPK